MSQKCILCGNDRKEIFLETKDRLNPKQKYFYERCIECDLVTLNETAKNKEFYTYNLDAEISQAQRFILWMVYKKIKRFGRGKKVLDFGCGSGNLAKYLSEKGYEVDCVDIDKKAIEWVKNVQKLPITERIQNKKYDIIILNDAYEHLPNPVSELNEIAGHLNNNGIIIIAIQNINSVQARIFKGRWFHLDAPRHLTQFYKDSFGRIVRACGLKIIRKYYFNLNIDPSGWYWSIIPNKEEKMRICQMLILGLFIPLVALTSVLKSTGQITYIIKKDTEKWSL